MTQLPITDTLEAKLQRVAAQYGLNLTRFLEKVVDEYWVDTPKPKEVVPPVDSQANDAETTESIIDREEAAYIEQHPEIFKRYANEYIAMHNGVLVDHDTNRAELRKRLLSQFGEVTIFITPVLSTPRQTIKVRGPRHVPNAK